MTLEYENAFAAIMTKKEADRCMKIYDALVQAEEVLVLAGADKGAVDKMIRSVKFSELAAEQVNG